LPAIVGAALTASPGVSGAASIELGLNFTSNIGAGSDSPGDPAPDAMGAVGPDAIVTLLNGQYAVFRKSDGAQLASDTLDGFWAAAGHAPLTQPFDPRLIYDPGSGRFFAVAVDWFADDAPADLLVAVSNSSDPTDGWSAFAVPIAASGAVGADAPGLGVDADGVYVTASKPPGLSSALLVMPKADLVAAVPSIGNATLVSDLPPNQFGFNPIPVTSLDGIGLPTKLLSATVEYFGVLSASTLSGPVAAPTLTPDPLILVPPVPKPPDARQPDAPALFQDRQTFYSTVVRRGDSIWAVHTVGVDDRAALEWFQFDATTAAILQSGLITDPALDLINGSIAVNEFGQLVIGFAGTSETQFPSAYAVLGETIDGTTSFGAPLLLKQGSSSIVNELADGRNIFSDISATVVDPDDPHIFWTIQEFGPGLAPDYWGVQVTQLRVIPEPGTTVLVALGLAALARLTPSSGRHSR
jgi:hypothetical protein